MRAARRVAGRVLACPFDPARDAPDVDCRLPLATLYYRSAGLSTVIPNSLVEPQWEVQPAGRSPRRVMAVPVVLGAPRSWVPGEEERGPLRQNV